MIIWLDYFFTTTITEKSSLNGGGANSLSFITNYYYEKVVNRLQNVVSHTTISSINGLTLYNNKDNYFSNEYLLYMWLYRLYNHTILRLFLMSLMVLCIGFFLGFAALARSKKLLSVSKAISEENKAYISLATIANLFYVIFRALYNYFCTSTSTGIRKRLIIKQKVLNSITRNAIYNIILYYIILVYFCVIYGYNGVWFFIRTVPYFNDLRFIASIIMSIGCVACYYCLIKLVIANSIPSRDIINSVMRSMVECMGLNLIAFANYARWGFLLKYLPHYNVIAIIVGILLHLLLFYIWISFEIYNSHHLLFSIENFFSFTFIAFSTNSIVEFFINGHIGHTPRVALSIFLYFTTTLLLIYFTTTLLAPPLYRRQIFNSATSSRSHRMIYIFRYTIACLFFISIIICIKRLYKFQLCNIVFLCIMWSIFLF